MARAQRKAPAQSDHPIYPKAEEKWRSSGLSNDHAAKLLLRPLTREEVATALGVSEERPCGVMIPYFDFNGRPTDFFRIRYLEKPPGFAGAVEKPQRYAQPAKTLNEVYLPPLMEASWKEVAEDEDVPIYVTEGEFKAAAGCAVGLACLGLGGVDLFRATKRGIELLPQLAEIKWDNRQVVIVYDSDAASNVNVVRAQRQLAHALIARGALPSVASLPCTKDGAKQGLDDYLIAHGRDALLKLLQDAPFFPEADALWSMSEEVVYVKDPGLVVARETGQRMDPNRFASHHYANRHYLSREVKGDKIVTKKKPLARQWIEWERRAEVERLSYLPGKPKLVDGTFNTWPGWGCEPVKGDISPWRWLLDHYFKDFPQFRKWFEQWCAYPLQHPGTKLFQYVLLWGPVQGTGKSMLSYMLQGIYGKNSVEIGNQALRASFNGWQENKQFIIGDEILANDARQDAEKLKSMIVQPHVRINQKFLPEYTVPDCLNYWFNSNEPDAMCMDDTDRRGFIWRVPDEKLSEEFFTAADKWLNKTPRQHDGLGPSHLFHHLLHLDLDGFNPSAPAPMTPWKENMILVGKTTLGMWVRHLLEDPTKWLAPLGQKPAAGCDLFTSRQLLKCFDPERSGRISEVGMGRELQRSRAIYLFNGKVIRTAAGVVRLYAIRNHEKWQVAYERDAVEHYNQFFGPEAAKF